MESIDENDNPNHIRSFSHKGSKNGNGKSDVVGDSNQNLPRSKSDSYRMNFKKRGVGNISQKSIDKFRKIQWDKEQNKKQ